MSRTIDIVLTIGILMNLIKGADFVLRPRQQAKIQSAVDTTTLYLEEMRPILWLQCLTTSRGQRVFLILGVIVAVLIDAVASIQGTIEGNYNPKDLKQLPFLVASFLALFPLARRWAPPFLRRLIGSGKIIPFWLRLFILQIIVIIPIYVYAGLLYLLVWKLNGAQSSDALDNRIWHTSSSTERTEWTIGMAILWPFLTYFLMITLAANIALYFAVICRLLEYFLKVCRAFAWRVVEYNKGAYAALTLIATVCLSLLKLFLHIDAK